ncbi:MAG: hypothetical protein OSB27_06800 [Planktomarina sp.]|nr:hypothetical protein [Planktomarina sp.]MDT2039735.1 arylsulfotransferase family protein [Planktomarina sp.]
MDFQKIGLLKHDANRSFAGYTMFGTLFGSSVRLVDNQGHEVHRWDLPGTFGGHAYIIPGGRLLCSVQVPTEIPLNVARGGRFLELSWDGEILWEHTDEAQHHDFRRLPDGNTVYIGWRAMTDELASGVMGGMPGSEAKGKIYEDYFRIITPEGETVWEWSTSKLNLEQYPISQGLHRGGFCHANTVCPLADGNFLISFRNLDMIAVLSPEKNGLIWEKRNHSWGRPHDPQPIDGGDRILFFANGACEIPAPQRSAVVELDAGTGEEVWRWEADIPWSFYSHVCGGVQRLPNGNTLVCEATNGRIFEIHRDSMEIVWDFINPDFSCWLKTPTRKPSNITYRAYRYSADSPELSGMINT